LFEIFIKTGKGAEIGSKDNQNKTPLHYALESNNQELISLLANKTLGKKN